MSEQALDFCPQCGRYNNSTAAVCCPPPPLGEWQDLSPISEHRRLEFFLRKLRGAGISITRKDIDRAMEEPHE